MENQTLQNRVADLEEQLSEAQSTISSITSLSNNHLFHHFELLFTHSRDIILFIQQDDGRILDANATATRAYGYSHEELLARTIFDLRAPGMDALTADPMARASSEGILFEATHQRQDGSTFPVEVSSQGTTLDGKRTLVSVIRDITERKKSEEEREFLMAEVQQEKNEIQQRAEELHAIIEAMHDPVMVYDQNGMIYLANAAAVQMHGFDPSHHHRQETNRTLIIHYPDGSLVDSNDLPSSRALRGESVIGEHLEIVNAQGRHLTFQSSSTPLMVNGAQTGAVSVWQDITEQKRAEDALTELTKKLERSNQELEQFALVASHDLQEPLRKIEVFGNMLLQNATDLKDRERNIVERMQNAASRMRDMINGLLQLSRVTTQGQPFERVDLAQVTAEVLSDLDNQVKRVRGKVEVGDLPMIEGDPLQIRLLMQNLISNGLKYQRPNSTPMVKVSARHHSAGVQIVVEDNGIGFDMKEAERIFKPFERLVGRSEYDGSGMGLAICQRIAERHGGEITVKSEREKGAAFMVTLPERAVELKDHNQ
jgi:two-component system, LuxR family, sensor kinase FixL